MAMISDLLYQLAGSEMAEQEIAAELRTDAGTVRQCLEKLSMLEIVHGPSGSERIWTAVPVDAPFDVVIGKAKSAGLNVRESLPKFVETAAG
jgi:HrcA family winged helix-turn-helix transcription repressor